LVKLSKDAKKKFDELKEAAEEAEVSDFESIWKKITEEFDEGETAHALLAKKMGWPKKDEGQMFALECLQTDLIARMTMPLEIVRFMPFYLVPTKERDYDRETKKWGAPYPIIRGAAIAWDEVDEEYRLAVITAKRDASKTAGELEVGKTYLGGFIEWGNTDAEVLGLAVAETTTFEEADDPIEIDPVEFLRKNYEKVPVKEARNNFTDPDDYLDFVLIEGKVVTSRIHTYAKSDSRDGLLTVTDDSIALRDMRDAQKTATRILVDLKMISPTEVAKIGKDTVVQALGPLKNRDQIKDGTEDEVERSWNPQLTVKALNIIRLVEKEEEEEPEAEEEEAEDAGDLYAEAVASKFDDEEEEEEYFEEDDEDFEEEEAEEEEPDEPMEEEDEEAEACDEFGKGYDPDDEACLECEDAEECEELSTASKKKKKGGKKKKKGR
jgi:hypothetical protein